MSEPNHLGLDRMVCPKCGKEQPARDGGLCSCGYHFGVYPQPAGYRRTPEPSGDMEGVITNEQSELIELDLDEVDKRCRGWASMRGQYIKEKLEVQRDADQKYYLPLIEQARREGYKQGQIDAVTLHDTPSTMLNRIKELNQTLNKEEEK